MEGFELKIVTPDGCEFEGEVLSAVVRTTEGDVGILRNHTNYAATIEFGRVSFQLPDQSRRVAACTDGFVSVDHNLVRIVATTFEFAEDIDVDRAKRAEERARQKLENKQSMDDVRLAEMKLKRALNRIHVYDEIKH